LHSVSTDLLENEKATLLGLIDLVFAYAYNQRTTMVRWLLVIDTHTHTHCWLTRHVHTGRANLRVGLDNHQHQPDA
jgi:hypothetical protein